MPRQASLWPVVVIVATGCSSGVVGMALPDAVRAEPICVMRHDRDSNDLASKITEKLRAAGIDANAGADGTCSEAARYRVAYIDHWGWDMRSYLARLTVEVIDPGTGEILAYGESKQSSLAAMGMGQQDVVDRAVSALIEGGRLE